MILGDQDIFETLILKLRNFDKISIFWEVLITIKTIVGNFLRDFPIILIISYCLSSIAEHSPITFSLSCLPSLSYYFFLTFWLFRVAIWLIISLARKLKSFYFSESYCSAFSALIDHGLYEYWNKQKRCITIWCKIYIVRINPWQKVYSEARSFMLSRINEYILFIYVSYKLINRSYFLLSCW